MVRSNELPVELWLEIFRCATLDHYSHARYSTEYEPFDAPPPASEAADAEETLHTKCALVQVCKQWRRWTMPFLYEDIRVPRTYHDLKHKLCDGEHWAEHGISIPPCQRFVRRALLPFSSTVTPAPQTPPGALDVIALCSALEVLVRTADPLTPIVYDFATPACPALPSLRRLDWWHHNEAARTGGINSLAHVLAAAPALRYLSVGGELWQSLFSARAPPAVLPALDTLRFRRCNALLVLQLCRTAAFPALRHVVFDHVGPAEMFWPLWDAAGAQLASAELGRSLRFFAQDFVAAVLAGAPALAALRYHVHFTHPPAPARDAVFLRTVALHAAPTAFCAPGSAEAWAHLERHFAALAGPAFPALREVRLHGDWAATAAADEFVRIARPLREKGVVVDVP
ncbi:uncharacterized protein BXZ73DRAFT_37843 [Epithele typhae]|uniref:uncharacterized protein n=1 Tax=Epithele typhae TaxID=378194 RepID=UPI002008E993|nr:uncharacterized protein BXZ73DRAFT_37843 [Epithele typhae]KAH9945860.1 hypothetical protein BXZ73DRAFT_37843 [Epithele typhae]